MIKRRKEGGQERRKRGREGKVGKEGREGGKKEHLNQDRQPTRTSENTLRPSLVGILEIKEISILISCLLDLYSFYFNIKIL